MDIPNVFLKPGKDHVATSRHPWIFGGAIDPDRSAGVPAGPVVVRDSRRELVGTGTYNPSSPIAVRLLTREERALDEGFFTERFQRALELRRSVVPGGTDGFRLLNGEGDGVAGLVVDSFAGHLVAQIGTPGIDLLRPAWIPALEKVFEPRSAVAKTNQAAANVERMAPAPGQLVGTTPDEVTISECGLEFIVAPVRGQKTGFFCDQRPSRKLVGSLARDRRVLDCYSYTGGFGVHALGGGAASVTCVESAPPAVALLERNLARAGTDAPRRAVRADAVEFLGGCDERFDLVVLDPPALAKRRRHVDRASRLYREIIGRGLGLVERGGLLLACSCSSAIDRRHFDQLLVSAARAADREVSVLHRGGAGADHPVSAFHPEGDYLKTVLVRVL